MADAAFQILKQDPKVCTGNFFIDEVVLREAGQVDFEQYRLSKNELIRDFFVPDDIASSLPTKTVSVYWQCSQNNLITQLNLRTS